MTFWPSVNMKRQNKLDTFSFIPWVIAGIFFAVLIHLRRKGPLRKIVVFAQAKIGDFVTQIPFFQQLKLSLPGSKLTIVLLSEQLKGLILCDPYVDEIIVWDEKVIFFKKLKLLFKLMGNRFDAGFNLAIQSWADFILTYALIPKRISILTDAPSGVLKFFYKLSGIHLTLLGVGVYTSQRYLSMLEHLGVYASNCQPKIFTCSKDEDYIAEFMLRHDMTKRPRIGVVVQTDNPLKDMPLNKLIELCRGIMQRFSGLLVLVGDYKAKEKARLIKAELGEAVLDTTGVFGLGQLACFLKALDVLVSVDSGPVYIAWAVGTALIDIAGPVDLRERLRPSAKMRLIESDMDCAPCSFACSPKKICHSGRRICLEQLDINALLRELEDILLVSKNKDGS